MSPARQVKRPDLATSLQPFFVGTANSSGEQKMYCPLCEDPDVSRSPSASINVAEGKWNCLKTEGHGGFTAQLAAALKVPVARITAKKSTSTSTSTAPPVLTDQDAPERWADALATGTGPTPKRVRALLAARGISAEMQARARLGVKGDAIAFPVRSLDGDGWQQAKFIGYPADGSAKRVTQTPGAQATWWPFEFLTHSPDLPVIVTEGELDCLLTNEKSEGRYVAVTGTGGADNPPADLSPLDGREVFIFYDADRTGRKGSAKLAQRLRERGRASVHEIDPTALGLTISERHGQDATDYFLQHGGTAADLIAEIDRLRGAGDRVRPRFQIVSAAQLAEPVPPMKWLVSGVWPEGSYGVLAGEKKTLKTYNGLALLLAVASGQHFLGEFAVPEALPVLAIVGEGGEIPTRRRLQRLAEWMELDLASLPIRMTFDSGNALGEPFLPAIEQAIADEEPGLIYLDPLYAFHPPDVEAQNLYARGAMFAEMQLMIPDGTSFVVADHFRKTGSKELDLDAVAQAGAGQWADSWILQRHDSPARVDTGDFSLGVQFGSRQWGGAEYNVAWSLGPFDADSGEHLGDITVSVSRQEWGAKTAGRAHTENVVASHILTLLEAEPLVHTRTNVLQKVKAAARVGEAAAARAFDELREAGQITSAEVPGQEGSRMVPRERWQVTPNRPGVIHLSEENNS